MGTNVGRDTIRINEAEIAYDIAPGPTITNMIDSVNYRVDELENKITKLSSKRRGWKRRPIKTWRGRR